MHFHWSLSILVARERGPCNRGAYTIYATCRRPTAFCVIVTEGEPLNYLRQAGVGFNWEATSARGSESVRISQGWAKILGWLTGWSSWHCSLSKNTDISTASYLSQVVGLSKIVLTYSRSKQRVKCHEAGPGYIDAGLSYYLVPYYLQDRHRATIFSTLPFIPIFSLFILSNNALRRQSKGCPSDSSSIDSDVLENPCETVSVSSTDTWWNSTRVDCMPSVMSKNHSCSLFVFQTV